MQKYCRECRALVMGQVDKTRPSKRVEWVKSATEMGFNYYFPTVHKKDLCYYHDVFKPNREMVNGIPKCYLTKPRPVKEKKKKKKVKVEKIKRSRSI